MRYTQLNKKLKKRLNVSLKRLRSYSRRSAMSRPVYGVQERRRRGMKGGLRSAKQLMNARQRERAKSKSVTLKKLYKRLQKASAKLQQLQHHLQSVLVVLEVPCVPLLFMSRPQYLHQQ